MTLQDLITEIITIPTTDLNIIDSDYKLIMDYRNVYHTSLCNTISRLIETSLDKEELRGLIYSFNKTLELPLVVALYRRYLWLDPTDTIMYYDFVDYLDVSLQERELLRSLVDSQNFDAALEMVENIFNNIFVNTKLISPVKLRTLADLTWEFCQIDHAFVDVDAMKKTKAYRIRCDYLMEQIIQRIIDPKINILELREFFTFDKTSLYILMDCDFGLEVAKRYLNINPTDRDIYGYVCHYLSFWNFKEVEVLILQYVAENNFDGALELINRDYSYYNISSRFASHHTTVV
jgi:hypothetical protein